MKRIVVLISGRGSNLEAIIAANLPLTIAAVISNEPDARGLDIARKHGIAAEVVPHRTYAKRDDFDEALTERIEALTPDLIVLAGFMRMLTDAFVRRFHGRLVNIHPSLLPAFPGLDTHRRALQAGVKVHGCTVHFVTAELDQGPIIMQAAVPVLSDDTPQTLAERVLTQEHRVYAQALRWFCEGRLALTPHGRVEIKAARQPDAALLSPALDS